MWENDSEDPLIEIKNGGAEPYQTQSLEVEQHEKNSRVKFDPLYFLKSILPFSQALISFDLIEILSLF